MLRDQEVAERLHKHELMCLMNRKPGLRMCDCSYRERVHNTLCIIKTIRALERTECEEIARVCGSPRAADLIRDRFKDDERR